MQQFNVVGFGCFSCFSLLSVSAGGVDLAVFSPPLVFSSLQYCPRWVVDLALVVISHLGTVMSLVIALHPSPIYAAIYRACGDGSGPLTPI